MFRGLGLIPSPNSKPPHPRSNIKYSQYIIICGILNALLREYLILGVGGLMSGEGITEPE